MASERTKLCPKCGYEYEPWVESCPDCGEPLQVNEPRLRVIKGELDPQKDPRWTQVTNVPNAIIGTFMKSQLEDAGIPVLMMRSRSADIAEFSHNDFVPQDILVPLHMAREARRLIDSPPGDHFGPHFPEEYEEYEDSEEDEAEGFGEQQTEPQGSLPPGWVMLPTEADMTARQQVRRSHGETLKGWYWSDEKPLYEEPQGSSHSDYEEEERFNESDEYYGPGAYSHSPSRWIRIMYGILLLLLSLPFILQILEQIWTTLGRFR